MDSPFELGRQWIAAMLNVANGVDAPQEVDDAIVVAERVADDCSTDTGADDEGAAEASAVLEDFNEGKIGPGACDADADARRATQRPGVVESSFDWVRAALGL